MAFYEIINFDDLVRRRQRDGCVKSSPAFRGTRPAIPLRAGQRMFYEAIHFASARGRFAWRKVKVPFKTLKYVGGWTPARR